MKKTPENSPFLVFFSLQALHSALIIKVTKRDSNIFVVFCFRLRGTRGAKQNSESSSQINQDLGRLSDGRSEKNDPNRNR